MKTFESLKKDIEHALKIEVTISDEDRLLLAALGIEIRQKVDEMQDTMTKKWEITHWLFGVALVFSAASFILSLTF